MLKKQFDQTKLKNGMRMVRAPMPSLGSVTVIAMVGVGSRYEALELSGISHFLEHIPFKGTEKYPDSMAVAEAIDSVGGTHNAFTGKEYTGYWVKVAKDKLDLALDMVSDLLLTPKLRKDDIEKERGVILEEINMYEDEPQAKVASLHDQITYEGSGLACDPAGTKETVSAMGHKDFLDHYNAWYEPKNVVIGIGGGINELGEQADESRLELANKVETFFSKGRERAGGGSINYGVPEQKKPRMKIFYKDTEQAHFYLGFPGISRNDGDRYALGILTTLLGGNSSARLFNEIREKRGLAYYAYASTDMFHDAGSFHAFEGVSVGKVHEAIKVTLAEFERLIAGKITDKQVVQAKEYMIGKTVLDLENSSNMVQFAVRQVLLQDKLEEIDEVLQKIRRVNIDEVKRVAKRLIDFGKLNLAVVGPYKDESEFGRGIGM